ncbi:MAG: hypothetical protein ACJAU7_002319 [Parvibaculaceae bacterium]|jgi:hypothetical protein
MADGARIVENPCIFHGWFVRPVLASVGFDRIGHAFSNFVW